MAMKMVRIGDFLTVEQIESCMLIMRQEGERGVAVKRMAAEVIGPAMSEINRKLGQENDAVYLAYMILYAATVAARNGSLS